MLKNFGIGRWIIIAIFVSLGVARSTEHEIKKAEEAGRLMEAIRAGGSEERISCLEKIARIRRETEDLERKVFVFRDSINSKEYNRLEEMLTRKLLELDNVEVRGNESLRSMRKDAIDYVLRLLSILEEKGLENKSNLGKGMEGFKKIERITEEVRDLERKINMFNGGRNTSEYRQFEEMLTGKLLELDEVLAGDDEELRAARKIAVKYIQDMLNRLEERANRMHY